MPVKFRNYVQIGSYGGGGDNVYVANPGGNSLPAGGVPPQCLTIADNGLPAWLNQPVDFTAYTAGLLNASAVLLAINVQRVLTFPAEAAFGLILDVAATANMVCPVKEIVSNVTIGSLIIMAGGTEAVWTASGGFSVTPGDRLRVYAPASQDATAAGVEAFGTALR